MTFELAIAREAREDGDDSRKRKKTKNLEFIMNSQEEFVFTEYPVSGRNAVNQESQALWSTASGSWSSKLIKTVRQHLYCHGGQ